MVPWLLRRINHFRSGTNFRVAGCDEFLQNQPLRYPAKAQILGLLFSYLL
jgi:hypothetical protein